MKHGFKSDMEGQEHIGQVLIVGFAILGGIRTKSHGLEGYRIL